MSNTQLSPRLRFINCTTLRDIRWFNRQDLQLRTVGATGSGVRMWAAMMGDVIGTITCSEIKRVCGASWLTLKLRAQAESAHKWDASLSRAWL